eukprot:3515842-Rhodomonas_salina.2
MRFQCGTNVAVDGETLRYPPTRLLCDVRYCHSVCSCVCAVRPPGIGLPACYALPSTELTPYSAYRPTPLLCDVRGHVAAHVDDLRDALLLVLP